MKEIKKMDTNMMELNINEMEQINGAGIFDTTLLVRDNFRNIIKRNIEKDKEDN